MRLCNDPLKLPFLPKPYSWMCIPVSLMGSAYLAMVVTGSSGTLLGLTAAVLLEISILCAFLGGIFYSFCLTSRRSSAPCPSPISLEHVDSCLILLPCSKRFVSAYSWVVVHGPRSIQLELSFAFPEGVSRGWK